MDFSEEAPELLLVLVIIGVFTVLIVTVLFQYLDKARLTIGYAALNGAQNTLKVYQVKNRTYPTSLDFSDCSDQDDIVVLNCEEIRRDIRTFVSYVGNRETFVLKAKARDSRQTLITVTESAISY